MQLRDVVYAVHAQAAGKIDERLLLVHLLQHPGRGLQRGELAVGVEDVELAVVLAEGRAGVRAGRIVNGIDRALALADDHGLQDAEQPVAVGGEVLEDVHRSAIEAHDGDQVGGGHLRAHEGLRRGQRAQLIAGLHGGHVKVEHQQTLVFVLVAVRRLWREFGAGERFVDGDIFVGRLAARQGSGRSVELLVLEDFDGLRHAALGDREIFCREAGDKVAFFVLHYDGFDDQL